jgi:S-adenosyl methyltransferase
VGDQWSTAVDTSMSSPARVYDYWLGGKDNFAVDRKAAHDAIAVNPGILVEVRANRAFLGRAVRLLAAEAGVRQFLDIGAGLPSGDNTHEVAQRIAPDSRVVYVDNDPMVAAHARALLTSSAGRETCCLDADLRDVAALLDQARQKLDFSQPIAVLLMMLLHQIPDSGRPYELVSDVMAAVPPGSYLVLSHPASDIRAQSMADMAELLTRSGPPMTARSHAEVSRFFDGLDLVEPGVVALPNWRPDTADVPPEYATGWCGVARKP